MTFELTLLGTSAAVPTRDRFLSGQVLTIQNQSFLIDCGEATQFRFKDLGIKSAKIDHIFISHLHGDHCFGIFGVLTSMAMSGREKPLTIYSPVGLRDMVESVFRNTYYVSPFPIHFFEIKIGQNTEGVVSEANALKFENFDFSKPIFEDKTLTINAFPLFHRVPTVGFLFKEKPLPRKIRPEKIAELSLSFEAIRAIKNGLDFRNTEGGIFPNSDLTIAPMPQRSFAYCSDTLFDERVAESVKGVDLLYHEATFAHDMAEQAALRGHATAQQAAKIAQLADVKKLIIGHFSSRYEDLTPLLAEAKAVFDNTVLGVDGQTYQL